MDSNKVSTSFSINKILVIQEQKLIQGFFKHNFRYFSTFKGIPGIQGLVDTAKNTLSQNLLEPVKIYQNLPRKYISFFENA